MQTGLIPVVSKESGVDVGDFGMALDDCAVERIEHAIRHLSSLSVDELARRSHATWRFARATHSREHCAARWQFVIDRLIQVKEAKLPLPPAL
jgi:hypothetical protein